MREILVIRHRMPTLADRYSAGENSFGLIRLALACGVLIAHAWPLGIGQPSLGAFSTSGQSDLGTLSVQGFFVVSGFLVTDSGLRSRLRRYVWHRFLRIFPGLWVCLLVTALVIAPLVALYERGSLAGFWSHPTGPFDYLATNVLASMEQYPISGLLSGTPYGQVVGGPSAFDGSLWSLRYEFVCYLFLGALIATAVLRRAPRAVLLLTAACYVLILRDLFTAPSWTIRPPARGAVGPYPLIGTFAADWLLYLGFLFLLGATARLYLHRIPMHRSLAVAATVALVGSLWQGAFIAIGLPAYAYLLLFLAVSLPRSCQRIGRGSDYSYGIYIYAFPMQQVIALIGGARYGLPLYILLSLLGTLALAMLSWHLVERPALGLKHQRLALRGYRQRHGRSVPGSPATPHRHSRHTPSSRRSRHAVGRRSVPSQSRRAAARRIALRRERAWLAGSPAQGPRYDLSYRDVGQLVGPKPPGRLPARHPVEPLERLLDRQATEPLGRLLARR